MKEIFNYSNGEHDVFHLVLSSSQPFFSPGATEKYAYLMKEHMLL